MIQSIIQYTKEVKSSWQLVWQSKKFKLSILLSFLTILPLFFYLNHFLEFIEQRPGCDLRDELLLFLPAADLSNWIFFVLYSSSLIAILYCLPKPWLLLRGFHILVLLQYIRNICLFFTPLNAPEGIYALHDPFLETFAYNEQANLKDLFFSGHTATIFIFTLLIWNNPVLRYFFGIITIIMAILLLIQHCHYTVDIIGGVAFAYLSSNWVKWIWLKIQLPIQ